MKKALVLLMLSISLVICLTACDWQLAFGWLIDCDEPIDHTHEFGEWSVTERPTSTKEGLQERICSCGESETERIAKLPAGYSVGLDYKLNEDGQSYSVSGIGDCTDRILVISPVYNELPVTAIGGYAFRENKNLDSIVIPDGVTSIDDYAFSGCISLTNIEISDSVTSIHDYAFDDCTGLKSIVIPASVKSIKNQAFSGCENIRDVYISDMDAWYDISFGDPASNPLCHGADLYLNGELVTELVTPDTVTSIRSFVFYGCTSLTKIVISDNVTSIGMWAFRKCTGLASIVIPNSVTSIDYRAFSDCDSLVYNEYDNADYLGNDLNPYLVLVKAKDTDITSCEIHPDTRFIHSWAFEECADLMSVVIPGGMAEIGVDAFEDCDALADVYYAGTEEEWEKIEKNFPYNRTLDRVTIHYSYAP